MKYIITIDVDEEALQDARDKDDDETIEEAIEDEFTWLVESGIQVGSIDQLGQDATMAIINRVQLASDLADRELRNTFKGQIDVDGGDCTTYTEEAQNIYNNLYDKYGTMINDAEEGQD